jgi:hypothetical protein
LDKFDELTTLVNVYDIFGKCYKNPSIHRAIHGLTETSDSLKDLIHQEGLTAAKYTPFLRTGKKNLKEVPRCVYA